MLYITKRVYRVTYVLHRYLLQHSLYDGLDSVLEVYGGWCTYSQYLFICVPGIEEEAVKAIRNARIVTVIDISEDGMVSIVTSEADTEGEANTVEFTPGTPTNITNPLNGETVEVILLVIFSTFYNIFNPAVYWENVDTLHHADQVIWSGHQDCGDQDLAV